MVVGFWQVACRGDGISDNNDVAILDASITFIQLQASAIGSRFLLFAPAGSYIARLDTWFNTGGTFVSCSCGISHATLLAKLEPVALRNRHQS